MKSINRGEQDGLHFKRGQTPMYEYDEEDLSTFGMLDVLERIEAFFTTFSYVTIGSGVCPYQQVVTVMDRMSEWMRIRHARPSGEMLRAPVLHFVAAWEATQLHIQ